MNPTILVIEDDRTSSKLLKLVLEREGFSVLIASDAPEGMRLASTQQPDLIILDILLPSMDGYEVCRYLRSDATTHDIPIVFFTTMSGLSDQHKGFAAGADDYLIKPVNITELLNRIEANLFFTGAPRLEPTASL